MFVRNRDVLKKKQEIEFFKKWRNVATDDEEFQSEVDEGLRVLEGELHQLEEKNKKWNGMFNG